jgi:hypothetical protein
MPRKSKEERQAYINEWKRRKRRERGLKPRAGPPKLTPEQLLISKQNRKDWEKEWVPMYRNHHPAKRMLWTARRRAKLKGQDFDIGESDILIPEVCPYLKVPMQSSSRRGDSKRFVMSLDRVDTSKGYIKGNVEVISWMANTMKSDASKEELLSFAYEIIKRYASTNE